MTRVLFSGTKVAPPSPASLDDAPLIPEATANIFSLITFGWITPLLRLGFARPLEAADLWKLQTDRSSQSIAEKINASYERRVLVAKEFNERLERGEIGPGVKGIWWSIRGNRREKEKEWKEANKKKASLVWAMNDSVKWWFWSAGLFNVVSNVAQITSPLVVKVFVVFLLLYHCLTVWQAIINFAIESYAGHVTHRPVPSIGKGIGLAFTLLALQVISSVCSNHFFYRSTSTGVLLRGGLITAIYSRSIKLTARARSTLTNGKLVNHISTDVSRIDFCAGFFHMSWTAPISLFLCLALLIVELGPSALAGFAVFVLLLPVQGLVMGQLFKIRGLGMEWTDKRVKLLQELLGGMKVIKFFAWEMPYLDRLSEYRKTETAYVFPAECRSLAHSLRFSYMRAVLFIRSGNNAIAFSTPTIASVVAFVIYAVTGHPLTPDVIFTSLTLFNLLRLPLMFLRMYSTWPIIICLLIDVLDTIAVSIATIADARNATERLTGVFEAEMLSQTYVIDETIENAVEVKGASFTWDAPPKSDEGQNNKKHGRDNSSPGGSKSRKGDKHSKGQKKPDAEMDEKTAAKDGERIFQLSDISLTIPRGQLVAIVGAVGSGKSSLLQGLIGEMRKTDGNITFGGSVGYCSQTSWIQV